MKEHLQTIGLSPFETEIYVFLTDVGPSTASRIARQTGIQRSMVYIVLHDLAEKQLVHRDDSKKVARFQITDPQHLRDLIHDQAKLLSLSERAYETIAQQLQQRYEIQTGKPGVRFYTGPHGLKSLYADINSSGCKEILIVRSRLKAPDDMLPIISEQIAKQRQLGIKVKVINSSIDTDLGKLLPTDAEVGTERRIIGHETFKNPSQIIIYNNKIACTTYAEPNITVLIEHADIAETLRSMYIFIWRQSTAETQTYLKKLLK